MSSVEFRRYLNNFLASEEGSELDGLTDVIQIKLGTVSSELNEHSNSLYGVLTFAQFADIALRPDLFNDWTDAIVELFRHKPFWDDIRFALLTLYRNFKIHKPEELGLDCKQKDYLKFLYRQERIIKQVLKIRTLCRFHRFDSCNQMVDRAIQSVGMHPDDFMMLAESLFLIQKTLPYDPEFAGDGVVSEWIIATKQRIIRFTPLTRYS